MSNTDVVRAFCDAWAARSLDAIMATLTKDARYVNVGVSDVTGHDKIAPMLEPFLKNASMVRFDLVHIAEAADGTVLTERVDVFETGSRKMSVPVMGVFEFSGGKISAWRDYFDTAAMAAPQT